MANVTLRHKVIANNKLIDYNRVVYSTQNPTGIQQKASQNLTTSLWLT